MKTPLKFGIGVDSSTFGFPRFATPRYEMGVFKTGKIKTGFAENLGHSNSDIIFPLRNVVIKGVIMS